MKKILLALFFSGCLFLAACGGKDDSYAVPDYKKWKKPLRTVLDYPVPGHGATYRIIYANDVALSSKMKVNARGLNALTVPDGAVIIKEIYKTRRDIGRAVPELTVMVKDRSNSRALDGWLYYLKKPGKDAVLIQERMCVGCHEAANEEHPYFDGNKKRLFRDYLFIPLGKK